MRKAWLPFLLLPVLSGCRIGSLPDPNDPRDVPPQRRAETLHNNLRAAADAFDTRVARKQITDRQRLALLAETANRLLGQGDWKKARPEEAWRYADLLITARRFQEAIPLLRKAVKHATETKNDDRRVNDSLRLARALAETGKPREAITLAYTVATSKPLDPGPVLPATLLEITPAAQGKGHDVALAKLLEEAIACHLRMQVDVTTPEGKMFLSARRYHIGNAWRKIVDLYRSGGREDLANRAARRWMRMMNRV